MKRRAAAWIFCILLVFQLAVPPVRAASSVYFIAAGIEVQPLSDRTMPFWSEGYLYIPATVFTGTVRKNLGVSYNYNESSQVVILYSSDSNRDRSQMYYIKGNYTQDRDGTISYPGAILRNGVPYVPASMVAKYFNLIYSVTEVKQGYLVWLRKAPGIGLTDKDFADAATYSLASVYAAYLKEKEAAQAGKPDEGGEPDTEAPVASSGRSIYLCLEANDATAAILDVLDRYHAQAAFFCTPEFLQENGDLLRRMTATGQTVGILADGARTDQTVEEQLQEGNRALDLATCGKTRLAFVKNGSGSVTQAVTDAGFRCLEPDLDRSGYGLQSTANANTLFQKLSGRRGDVTVWLADTANAAGLRAFLSTAEKTKDRCLSVTETV